MPALYIVATPIGNLEDITLHALRILREVKLIAAEDTRHTKKLLSAYEINTAVTSYHEHNKLSKLDYLLDCLADGDLALVSDAGMPGISDPGYELIKAAIERHITVVPIPGPSAVLTALVVSGLPTDSCHYTGFLPRKTGERKRCLEALCELQSTLIILESPHRIRTTLEAIGAVLGNRQIAVCRELTKLYEEVFRGTVQEAIDRFAEPKGEFVLVVEGNIRNTGKPQINKEIEDQMRKFIDAQVPAKKALAELATQTGISRKELYRTWIQLLGG